MCIKYPDLLTDEHHTSLWMPWSVILTLLRSWMSCQVHDNQNSHCSSTRKLRVDDGTLLSQLWLWPYCKLKMWRLCLEFLGQNNPNSFLLYVAPCTARPWAGGSFYTDILSREVRSRVVKWSAPHVYIKLLGHVLLFLTVVPQTFCKYKSLWLFV